MKLGRGWDGGGRAASKSRPLESHKIQSMPAAVLWDAAEGCSSTGSESSPLGNGRMTTLANGPERRVDDGMVHGGGNDRKGVAS